jgi:hypothetical protein
MSSAASTKGEGDQQRLQPWQFFVLTALACATVLTFLARGAGAVPVVMFTVLMFATALAGLAMLRTLRPLVGPPQELAAEIGERTRAFLEREKMLALRAIKELEFDKAMGKVSDEDFHEMTGRLRARAGRIMRQIDAGSGYRAVIERDLAKRLTEKRPGDAGPGATAAGAQASPAAARAGRTCAACDTSNDPDARFCKGCGAKL